MNDTSTAALLKHQTYGVIGAGKSGLAAVRLLLDRGKKVIIFDDKAPAGDPRFDEFKQADVELRLGPNAAALGEVDALIVSPGIACNHRLLVEAEQRGLPMRGEIELGFLAAGGPRTVAITGTNGKTTVTMLIESILRDAGMDAIACGNIGHAYCDAILEAGNKVGEKIFVAEISSFQLETIEHFAPEVALILNITADHLDRHETMEGYAAAKARITHNQLADQTLVINQDDPNCLAIGLKSRARVRHFSLKRPVEDGAFIDGDLVYLAWPERRARRLMAMDELQLIGLHNVSNAMAAACAAEALGVERESIAASLAAFQSAPHRMELVGTLDGVRYVNDSKATNLGAMLQAIECFGGGLHLIAGGRDKNSPFASVVRQLEGRVNSIYLIGEAAQPMRAAWSQRLDCVDCGTLDKALETARDRARDGDVILLSPGCASFDQFNSYAHRGDTFREWVQTRTLTTTPDGD